MSDRLLVLVMVIESLLLLTGSPLCSHFSEGGGIPSKVHIRVKVLFMLKDSKRRLVVFTLGTANGEKRELITSYCCYYCLIYSLWLGLGLGMISTLRLVLLVSVYS